MKRRLKATLLFFGCLICVHTLLIYEFMVGKLSALGLAVTLFVAVLTFFILSALMWLSFMKKRVAESLRNDAVVATNGYELGSRTFVNVWYSPRKRWYDLHLLTYRDVGSLTISEKSVEFEGRSQKLVLENIRRVSLGRQGRDFVNNWVRIDYGNDASPSTALFADGNMLGWRGVLGGTERIFDTAKQIVPQ